MLIQVLLFFFFLLLLKPIQIYTKIILKKISLFLHCFLYRTQLSWFKLLVCPTPCYHWTNKSPILTNSWISRNPKQTSRNKGEKWNLLIKMHEVLQPEEKLVKKKNLFTKTLIVPGSHRQSSHPKEKPCYIWVTIQKN